MKKVQFKEVTEWQNKTFGKATSLSKIAHLKKEIKELIADIKSDNPNKRSEFADCFILLFGAAASDGMSYEDICDAIDEKMAINREREWGEPDAEGVVNHVPKPENKYDIKCIGFKKSFFGDKMWYYKLIENKKEYLFVEAGFGPLLDMVWTENNEFDDSDLSKKILKEIGKEIESIPKSTVRLNDEDGEHTFFTQHEIKLVEEDIVPRKEGHYSYDEINSLLSEITSYFSMKNKGVITRGLLDAAEIEDDHLIGYNVSYKKDGSHKNDGQMVEYSFTFTSPAGVKTHIETEMCLMVGFNTWDDISFK